MLSETWDEKMSDTRLQHNLQRDLAKIMLSLSSVPLPRIGSFRIDRKGYIRLDNRPLDTVSTILENEGVPLDTPRDTTFSRVDDFVHWHLDILDKQLLHQPNAARGPDDGTWQMATLAAARVVLPQMFQRNLNHGPFVFSLTDLHRSNIFVDEDWNITCIIDLEFAGSYPVEFVQPPYWLGGRLIDGIEPTGYASKHAHFIEILREQEEQNRTRVAKEPLSTLMERAWTKGTFWVTLAFLDAVVFPVVFSDRILPFFSVFCDKLSKDDYKLFARLWRPDFARIIERKSQDQINYLNRLKREFD